MRLEILNEKIYYYKDLIDDVDSFIKDINSSPVEWTKWESSDHLSYYGKRKSGKFSKDPIFTKIKDIVLPCIKNYSDFMGKDFGILPDYCDIKKYEKNEYMGIHVDNEDGLPYLPTISMVFYINDDYEGGNIIFPKQGLNIKPEKGSLIIFPSVPPYYHDPRPVVSGVKYMSPLFMYDLK